ncbi:MAG: T9SS type A sorting domain-containing protein, partial [Saprospiraceae bacterium]
VRDVIRVLSAYRFKADESFNYSEMFFDPETLPIATEYLPFIMLNNKSIDIVNANVYPNPSNGKVKLDFQNDSFQKADLVIYDTNGKEIKRSKVTVNAGQNNIELNRDQFGAAGNYVVKIELDKKIISSRVTIIN